MTSAAEPLAPGDRLKIERRYVVDGELRCVTDEGRFAGIERVGSLEHIVLRDAKSREVRMFPLHAVSEITLVHAARRAKAAPPAALGAGAWDPGFA